MDVAPVEGVRQLGGHGLTEGCFPAGEPNVPDEVLSRERCADILPSVFGGCGIVHSTGSVSGRSLYPYLFRSNFQTIS